MGKVLFFDIDGTLVNADGVVPASAKKALEQARMAGHRLVICSGHRGTRFRSGFMIILMVW